MTVRALLVLATLAGCAPDQHPAVPTGRIVLAEDGLRIAGSGLEIGFGRAPEGTIAAVTRLLGRGPEEQSASACGRVVRWPGLALTFRSTAFTGWQAEPGRFDALPGIGTSAGATCPA